MDVRISLGCLSGALTSLASGEACSETFGSFTEHLKSPDHLLPKLQHQSIPGWRDHFRTLVQFSTLYPNPRLIHHFPERALYSAPQSVVCGSLWRVPEPFQGIHEVENTFKIIVRHSFPFSVLTFALMVPKA